MQHSVIGGSSAHIYVECPAYAGMIQGLPPLEPTAEMQDGTAAHRIGEGLIRIDGLGWQDYRDERDPATGLVYTREMFDAAETYADDVNSVLGQTPSGYDFRIEHTLQNPCVHPSAFGTPDCWVYSPAQQLLTLWDFKYGRRYVPAEWNWQAVFYFAALLNHYQIDGLDDQKLWLEFRVVQPRYYRAGGPVRTWRLRASDLRGPINQLAHAAAQQFQEGLSPKAGWHCRDCPAQARCPAATRTAFDLLALADAPTHEQLSPRELGAKLLAVRNALQYLGGLDRSLTEQVERALHQGQGVPGWGLTPTVGRLTWAVADADVTAIGDMCGVDLRVSKVKTPTQAKAAGLDANVIEQLAQRSSGWATTSETEDSIQRALARGD
jgi:hypothetical protein